MAHKTVSGGRTAALSMSSMNSNKDVSFLYRYGKLHDKTINYFFGAL